MKKLVLLFTVLSLSFVVPSYAADDVPPVQMENTEYFGDVFVSVNGLVCDFCARALEKVFGKEESVNKIDINLDTKIIAIDFNEGQSLDDARITQLITDSGYNVEDIRHAQ